MKEDLFSKISPVQKTVVPEDRRSRNPLITQKGFCNFLRLKQHPQAPIWNFETGDRIERKDLKEYLSFQEELTSRTKFEQTPPQQIINWIKKKRPVVLAFQKQVPDNFNIKKNWEKIATLTREDIVTGIATLVPLDVDLSRLIVYDTSGTTGHAMVVPHHPAAMAKVMAMMEYVLHQYGIKPNWGPEMTSCINVGAQSYTVVFPNVFSVWKEAAFAKVNLHPDFWRKQEDAQEFFTQMAPFFITGDPIGFAEMLRWEIDVDTNALFNTALLIPQKLRQKLKKRYKCPVIDWYSTTETGPIGYSCREECGFHILPHDVYIEIIDEKGKTLAPGELGEITVTGGRNPYLPLLRYRTGDMARMIYDPCKCGDHMPRIVDLQARKPVLFKTSSGTIVNSIDVGRILRDCHIPMVQHQFTQRLDGSCDLKIRPIIKGQNMNLKTVEEYLQDLFKNTEIRIHIDENLGSEDPIYINEAKMELLS